ncbi:MAG: alanine racemase [Sphingomonadaceae bacterium]|nr:alanine racemase [Sphingomonadaceae bacterium]
MTSAPDSLLQAPTPALVLDEARLAANIRRMEAHLAPFGVAFRPHVKTAKSPDVLRAVLHGTGPITVSTLLEARMFAEAGFDDILYAVGIVPAKLDAARALADAGVRMQIILDDAGVAREVADALAGQSGITVLIEVDCDGHRSGVAPDADDLLVIGRTLADADLLGGVLTHAGDSYGCKGADAIAAHAELERAGLVRAAERLRAAGLPCPVVSMGSTPTALFARALDGITEVRAGVYIFQDLVMAGIGVCRPEEIALSVLATVIGYQKAQGRLVIDAGWMAMSRDRGTAGQRVDQGYGLVCDVDGTIIGDLVVTGANQEHGLVGHRDGTPLDLAAYPIGTRLRVLPNHACATAAQHPAYLLTDRSGRIAARWPRFSGW